MSGKVIVVAMDGATFRVLDRLMKDGSMPYLRSMVKNGTRAVLESTVPPITAPAWATFYTGVNSGRHGLYSFFRQEENGLLLLASSHDIHGLKLWQHLNSFGKTVGLLNLELTYPLPEIDGYVVPLYGEGRASNVPVFPPELSYRLISSLGKVTDIMPAGPGFKGSMSEKIHTVREVTQFRIKQYKWLLHHRPVDLAIALFKAPDILQHRYYRWMDPEVEDYHSPRGLQIRSLITPILKDIDAMLGEIRKSLTGGDTLIVMSDHGFQPMRARVMGNLVLMRLGLLKASRCKYMLMRLLGKRLLNVWSRFQGVSLRSGDHLHRTIVSDCVDGRRSRAYFGSPAEQGIFLYEEGISRDRMGQEVERIKEAFLSLRDPATGASVFTSVDRREDLFRGPYVEVHPHIVLQLEPGFECSDELVRVSKKSPWEVFSRNPVSALRGTSGFHDRFGVFVGQGPALKKGHRAQSIRMADMFPLLSWLAGCPIPRDLDGRVPETLIDDAYVAVHPVRFGARLPQDGKEQERYDYDAEEKDAILRRLSGLGYA